MLIGANVSMKGTKMLLGAVEEAASYDANTLQFYTGAPQNTRRKPTSEMHIPEGLAAMTKDGISHTVIHAPYIVNLGNTKKPENFEFAVQFMREEVAGRMRYTPIPCHFIPVRMWAPVLKPPSSKL